MASLDTLATGIEGLRAAMAAQAEAYAEQMQSLGMKLAELDHRLEEMDAGISQPQSMTVTTEIPAAQVSELLAQLRADVKEELSKSRPVYASDDLERKLLAKYDERLRGIENKEAGRHPTAKYLAIGAVAFSLVLGAINCWQIRDMKQFIDATYGATTFILTGEEKYFHDGENYAHSLTAPTRQQLEGYAEKIHRAASLMKEQQAAAKQEAEDERVRQEAGKRQGGFNIFKWLFGRKEGEAK